MPSANKAQPKFLSSWKEIANYMGKGVRTVQRYEVQLGLPVRRPAGKPRGSVVASCAEIDAWIAASPIRKMLPVAPRSLVQPQGMPSIRDGIREMQALREQMSMLRKEHRASLQLLVSSLHAVTRGAVASDLKRNDMLNEVLNSADLMFIPHNGKPGAKDVPMPTVIPIRRRQD